MTELVILSQKSKTMEPDIYLLSINTIILMTLVYLLILSKHIFSRNPPLPPGPFAWPLVGNLFHIGKNPHVSLAHLAKVHGPLMSLRLGTQLLVVASTPAAARQILKTDDRKFSGRYTSHTYAIRKPELNHLSLGFAKECTNQWRLLKTLSRSKLFSMKAVESHKTLRETKIFELTSFLREKAGQVVDIRDVAYITFINIMSNLIFSTNILDYKGNGVGKELKQLFEENIEMGGAINISDYYPFLDGLDIQGLNRRSVQIFNKTVTYWKDVIARRRKQRSENSSRDEDFLDTLLDRDFTDDQIQHLATELLSAGSDTSASVIEWAMVELVKNQDVMNKLRTELGLVVGKDTVKESHLLHLPYLQACVKEILRLHPPAPLLLPHLALETCQVVGYTIPKNSQVVVNTWAISRDPTLWDDPLRFKPERFIDSSIDFKGNDFEYIPFSGGRRICGGMSLAAVQIPLVLANFVHLFDWDLLNNMDSSVLDVMEKLNLTMKKENPFHLIPKLKTLVSI